MFLDDSAWPILRIRLGAVREPAPFDEMVAWYALRLERAHAEDVHLYVLSDADGSPFNLQMVRHVARWQVSLSRKDLDRCALSVVVSGTPDTRRLLTAMQWFARPLARIAVVASEVEGWHAIVDDHARRGLAPPVPPAWLAPAG